MGVGGGGGGGVGVGYIFQRILLGGGRREGTAFKGFFIRGGHPSMMLLLKHCVSSTYH